MSVTVSSPLTRSQLASVTAFLERYPRLAQPAGAASQCAIATYGLVDQLAADGHTAQVVWVRSPVEPFPSAHPRALLADEHALVRLADGGFVDVTRRQFDPSASFPVVYESERALAAHWAEINFDSTRHSPWRPVLPPDPSDPLSPDYAGPRVRGSRS